MTPLVSPALVAAANPHTTVQSQAARKANAEAYAAAMRDAGAPAAPTKAAASRPEPVAPAFAREAPFGAERPRYQRPGSVLDLRV